MNIKIYIAIQYCVKENSIYINLFKGKTSHKFPISKQNGLNRIMFLEKDLN